MLSASIYLPNKYSLPGTTTLAHGLNWTNALEHAITLLLLSLTLVTSSLDPPFFFSEIGGNLESQQIKLSRSNLYQLQSSASAQLLLSVISSSILQPTQFKGDKHLQINARAGPRWVLHSQNYFVVIAVTIVIIGNLHRASYVIIVDINMTYVTEVGTNSILN